MKIFRKHYLPYLQLCVLVLEGIGLVLFKVPVLAQIAPDGTLGAERSVVKNNANVKGSPAELIEGGAARGSNLFHSFQDFNVNDLQRVYFANPAGVENILSRVTGGNASNILGTLGVDGAANLFLLNPNGIIFGQDAKLDVSGSFVGSTAEGIKLGEDGLFSAADPSASQLIGVEPGALFHNALREFPGAIQNAAQLEVKSGKSLILSGHKIINTGTLKAPGGIIALFGNEVNLNDKTIIDVSANTGGGTVLVGGDYQGTGNDLIAQKTFVGSNAEIKADAVENGDGGKVIVWADETTEFYGDISAKGGSESGDGGFVEVSGKENLAFDGFVDTSAEAGQNGTLLLDPKEIIIADGNGAFNDEEIKEDKTTTPEKPAGEILSTDLSTKEPNNIFTISKQALEEASKTTDIHLEATNNITVNDLTDDKLNLQKGIKLHTTASDETEGITFIDSNDEIITNGGKIHLLAESNGSLTNIGSLTSKGGNIILDSAKDIDIPAKSRLVSGGGHITLNAGQNITITEKNIPATPPPPATPVTPATVGSIDAHANIGGNITIKAGEIVTINGDSSVPFEQGLRGIIGTIDTDSLANRPGGNITIDGKKIELNNARVTAESSNNQIVNSTSVTVDNDPHDHGIPDITDTNPGLGKIEIGLQDKENIVTINNSRVVSDSHGFHFPPNFNKGDASNAGDISIGNSDTQTNAIKAGSQITAEAHSHRGSDNDAGKAGSISVKGKNIEINGENTKITATTFGDGKGGDILIGNIKFDESDTNPNKKPIPIGNITESIKINGESLAEKSRPKIIAETSGASSSAEGGNIFVDANTVEFNNTLISSTTGKTVEESHEIGGASTGQDPETGLANAGNISIDAGEKLTIKNYSTIESESNNSLTGSGDSGNITLNARTIEVSEITNISSTSNHPNSLSGDITVIATGNDITTLGSEKKAIEIKGSTIEATSKFVEQESGAPSLLTGNNSWSEIKIDAEQGSVNIDRFEVPSSDSKTFVKSEITTTNSGSGFAGDIGIGAANNINILNGSQISSDGKNGGIGIGAGVETINVTNNLSNVTIDSNSKVSTNSNSGSEFAGDIGIGATNNINILKGSHISSDGKEGEIGIGVNVGRINAANKPLGIKIQDAQVTTENQSTNKDDTAGNIGIQATDNVEISDISSNNGTETLISSTTSGTGDGGNITITSNKGNITSIPGEEDNFNKVKISSASTSTGNAGTIKLETQNPEQGKILLDNVKVSSEASKTGDSNDITLDSTVVELTDNTEVLAQTTSGNSGKIVFSENLKTLDVTNSAISSSTNTGQAQNFSIIATEGVEIDGVYTPERETEAISGGIFSEAKAFTGKAGSIEITAPDLTVTNSSKISAENFDDDAKNNITIKGLASNLPEGETSLEVSKGAEITTSTRIGQAGDVLINQGDGQKAADSIKLDGGAIAAKAEVPGNTVGNGSSGNIEINAKAVELQKNSEISSETEGGISGTVLFSNSLETIDVDSSKISSSTQSGIAKDLSIKATESITLDDTYTPEGETEPVSGGILSEATENAGKAGNITIDTPTLTVKNNSLISAKNIDDNTDNPKNVELKNVDTLELNDGGTITASTETGKAGNIFINKDEDAAESLKLDGGTIAARASDKDGTAGNLDINAKDVDVIDNSQISAENENDQTSAGKDKIKFSGVNTLDINNSEISASTKSGTAGNITVTASERVTLDGSIPEGETPAEKAGIFSEATTLDGKAGKAGNITVDTPNLTVTADSKISANNVGDDAANTESNSKNVELKGIDALNITSGGEITASTETGVAGDVSINQGEDAANSVTVSGKGSAIAAQAIIKNGNETSGTSGTAGNVAINTQQLTVQGGGNVTTSTGSGTAGNITINGGIDDEGKEVAADSVKLDGGAIAARASENNGKAGNIDVNAKDVNVLNNSEILAENKNDNTSGEGNITLAGLNTLDVNKSLISASTESGTAGDITVDANASVTLDGQGTFTRNEGTPEEIQETKGGILSEATEGGNASSLNVTTPSLTVQNGAKASVSSSSGDGTGTGNSGDLTVNAQTVKLDNQGQITAETEAGDGGDITLATVDTLEVNVNNSKISTSTKTGTAGSVFINKDEDAANSVSLDGGAIAARATGENGTAGNIDINAQKVVVNGANAQIAATNKSAPQNTTTGNITLQGLEIDSAKLAEGETSLKVSGGGEITTSTKTGRAGNIEIYHDKIKTQQSEGEADLVKVIAADSVNLNGGAIAAQAIDKDGTIGTAGDVAINTRQLTLTDGGNVTTSTGSGTAGNITIDGGIDDKGKKVAAIELNDSDISSNATGDNGTAGDIDITAKILYLEEGSDISAGFPDGENTEGINKITAGNITLNIDEQIRLSGLSDISTNGTDGGKITIGSQDNEVGSILAARNSDIVATNIDQSLAEGRIDIFADIVLGLKQRDKRTGLNDVTSDSGDLESLEDQTDVDTTELPDAPIDVASLIDRRCAIASDDQVSSFTVTGKGGLPPNLRDSLSVPGLLPDFGFDDPNAENIEANNNTATFSLASQTQPLFTAENLPTYCLFSDNSSQ